MKTLILGVQKQFEKMCKTNKLFVSSVSGTVLWDKYLNSFESDPVFRDPSSTTHSCKLCNNFIRRYGNIVSINENGKIESMFSNIHNGDMYDAPAKACAELLESAPIANVFFESFLELNSLPYEKNCNKTQALYQLNIPVNYKMYTAEEAAKYGVVTAGKSYEFNHFNVKLPTAFVLKDNKSVDAVMAEYRDKKEVFKRAMVEISKETLLLVRDLILQGSLLDGNTHLSILNTMIDYKTILFKDGKTPTDETYWDVTYGMHEGVAKFKNHLIGVLCTELEEGKELNLACKTWNQRVDPVNYNKAKAPITEAQRKLAEKFVIENGYLESFTRRLATLDDIKASEILHLNRDNNKAKSVNIFDTVKTPSGNGRYKRSQFDGIEEVHIDKFMSDILPNCTNVELLLENRFEGNLVNLTTSAEDSKRIFKWDNPFSYTFNGNLAGKSQIKENVKNAGGKVDGKLRCSLQWNDAETIGHVDFDLHCIQSKGDEIYYGHKQSYMTRGWLDVDMIRPTSVGIENITWQHNLPDMEYRFYVRNFDGGQNTGFKVEIEFGGEVFNYHVTGNVHTDTNVATVIVKNGVMSIKHHLPESTNSRKLWDLDTNEFHKVNLVCLTPNHWGDNNVGNKHFLFMLQGCKNPNSVRGFHNEHLISDLLEHRKVLDVLGNSALIEPTDNQLAGVGFNATVKDDVVLKLSGTHKRTIRVKF